MFGINKQIDLAVERLIHKGPDHKFTDEDVSRELNRITKMIQTATRNRPVTANTEQAAVMDRRAAAIAAKPKRVTW